MSRKESDVYHMTEEQRLRQQLADLHHTFMRDSTPIVRELAHIELCKPPAPVWLGDGQWAQFNPEVLAKLTGQPVQKPENPGERMRRLEFELGQANHALRMVLSAPGDVLPSLLVHIKAVLGENVT